MTERAKCVLPITINADPAGQGVACDEASGQFVCEFVSRLPTTNTGLPFQLYRWQRDALMEFYGTMEEESGERLRKYWYLYLEIPKKNGKSELAAALGLYHLFGDGELNSEVYICAADKENAGIVFRAAAFMLETAPWTAKMVARGELNISKSQKKSSTAEESGHRTADTPGSRWASWRSSPPRRTPSMATSPVV